MRQHTSLQNKPDSSLFTLYYVDGENGDDATGDGSQVSPWRTITYALSQVSGVGVEIRVASGVYDQALGETFPISLPAGTRLIGAGKNTTIISGQSNTSVLYIGSATTDFLSDTVVSDLAMQNGSHGLRLYSSESHTVAPTISNLLLRWNTDGIYITTSDTYKNGATVTATISNTEIISNTRYGVYMKAYGYFSPSNVSPLFTNSLVEGNGSHGMYIQGSAVGANDTVAAPQIIATDIMHNGGHGIYATGTYQGWVNAQIEQSRIENNQGYGFYWNQGINRGNINTSITNTVIALNQGGGLHLEPRAEYSGSGTLRLINSTVVNNENYGIYWERTSSSIYEDIAPRVVNTILWNPDADDLYSTGGAWSTTEIQYSDIKDGDLAGQSGNFYADPLLSNDHHLYAGSPAIDSGTNNGCPSFDLWGIPRPQGSNCDVGVHEHTPEFFFGLNQYNIGEADGTATITVTLNVPLTETATVEYYTLYQNAADEAIPNQDYVPISGTLLFAPGSQAESFNISIINNDLTEKNKIIQLHISDATPEGTVFAQGDATLTIIDDDWSYIYLPTIMNNYCSNYFDNFSNPASGWEVSDDIYARAEYLNGEYRILSKLGGYLYMYDAPTCNRDNYTVEVDAKWQGTIGKSYGLLFDLADGNINYYIFMVSTDYKQFRLYVHTSSGFTEIVPATDSSAINGGTASNHLGVTRDGNLITLSINGTNVKTLSNSIVTGANRVGIYATAYSTTPNSDTRFDNFSVNTIQATSMQNVDSTIPKNHELDVPRSHIELLPDDLGW